MDDDLCTIIGDDLESQDDISTAAFENAANPISSPSQMSDTMQSQDGLLDTSGELKKVPSLNEVYEIIPNGRGSHRMSQCRGCDKTYSTNEIDRLVAHTKVCKETRADKKRRVSLDYQACIDSNDAKGILLTKMIVENNVSIRFVESKSFLNFAKSLSRHYRPPTRVHISDRFIPQLSRKVESNFVRKIQREKKPILSIEFDHWTDANRRSLLGVIATCVNGNRFVCDVREENLHTTSMIVDALKQSLSKIPSGTINAFISDSASSRISARRMMTSEPQYKHVIHHRCIAHLLNRLGGHLSDSKHNLMI